MGSFKTKRLVIFEAFVHRDKTRLSKGQWQRLWTVSQVKILWMLLCWRFSKYKETWNWNTGGWSSVQSPFASLSLSSALSSTQTASSPTCCRSGRRCFAAGFSPSLALPHSILNSWMKYSQLPDFVQDRYFSLKCFQRLLIVYTMCTLMYLLGLALLLVSHKGRRHLSL